MHMKRNCRLPLLAGLLVAALALADTGYGQASPYRGLWVGTASLRAVNEVAVPLDQNNNPVAPNPEVPTPTFDEATIRVIIHVNGAGQASLLKDVAILARGEASEEAPNPDIFLAESDLSLITDPRLYTAFEPQPGTRIASAVFDFGDAAATRALDALMDQAVQTAATYALDPGLNVSTEALRVQARQAASALAQPLLDGIVENADVAESFGNFLLVFTGTDLDAIAADSGDPVVATRLGQAQTLRDQSVYGDSRAVDMVNAVVAAVNAAIPAEREQAAHNTASAYADVQNLYQRFVSGKAMGDMIRASASNAAAAAQAPGATEATIETALRALPESVAAITESLTAKIAFYNDTRSTLAVNAVFAAMAQAAFANAALDAGTIAQATEQAGRGALAAAVARYPLPVLTPTLDYNEFVDSAAFAGSAQKAADAAAEGAVFERGTNPLYSGLSVSNAARIAVAEALRSEYAAAARVQRTELPLEGDFAPGSGDPRLLADLTQPSDLGAPGLTGVIYLPASHPTNPFRHRRHPDHTVGFNVERHIRIDFDGEEGDALEAAAFGVDRISGTYREELFGLHKPLGPQPETQPIGLRTEGRLLLNRVSYIDTLNTL